MHGEFEALDPATEQVVGLAPHCTAEQLDAAMASAQAAFPAWSRDRELRSTALRAATEKVLASAEELGPVLTAEQGGSIGMSIGSTALGAQWLTYYAYITLPDEVLSDAADRYTVVTRRPVGPAAAITAWNAPLMLGL